MRCADHGNAVGPGGAGTGAVGTGGTAGRMRVAAGQGHHRIIAGRRVHAMRAKCIARPGLAWRMRMRHEGVRGQGFHRRGSRSNAGCGAAFAWRRPCPENRSGPSAFRRGAQMGRPYQFSKNWVRFVNIEKPPSAHRNSFLQTHRHRAESGRCCGRCVKPSLHRGYGPGLVARVERSATRGATPHGCPRLRFAPSGLRTEGRRAAGRRPVVEFMSMGPGTVTPPSQAGQLARSSGPWVELFPKPVSGPRVHDPAVSAAGTPARHRRFPGQQA
jgi:hypothetical protein